MEYTIEANRRFKRKPNPVAALFAHKDTVDMCERHEMITYLNLDTIRAGHGDYQALTMITTRLMLGRMMAWTHFDDADAEEIHETSVAIYKWAETIEEDQLLRPSDELLDRIGAALNLIAGMVKQLSSEELHMASLRAIRLDFLYDTDEDYEVRMWPWAKFKQLPALGGPLMIGTSA